ncbi:unnamed protein product [Adineta steineri]|uniref:BOS complex subunit NCLN n=5 Tax=Adineta steineri TaxID=433720 RepID=A0A818Z7F0_9BILA|nr:unnamed protein product [Adineta steineri]CAF3687962.1 unnamed protein product [Adineta steineri]CAF3765687.1 unnamed protein product [Adineta steineri]CAF3919629.1 unnamed protein product [Adineta steineri]
MFEINDLFDTFIFRTTTLTGFLFYWLPIICILSPTYLSPFTFVDSTQEFKAYRMAQYDLYGQAYGSRQAFISSEVRLWSHTNLNRKAALIRLEKLTIERFRSLISKGINSLFVVIPPTTTPWTAEQKTDICDLETILLGESVPIPVYFLPETQQTNELYKSIESRRDSTKDSALAVLYDMVTADGYQLSVTTGKHNQRTDSVLYNINGKLVGHGIEERLPKILFVAHYDSIGLANGLAQGADSNASGVLILLKLIRLFSKLYSKQTTRAKYNLHFLFAAGGKLNYQGSKKWIDDYHDQKQQQQLPNDVDVVVCLDSLGQSNQLYMHVSKPPKDTQTAGILRELLTQLTEKSAHGPLTFEQIHKKILKTSDFVAWEHEKYSWSKLPAFTLSHFNSSKTCSHSSISDIRDDVDLTSIERNYQYISDALIRLIFNKTDINLSIIDQNFLLSDQQSEYDQLTFTKQWLTFLTNYSRSPSLLTKTHPIVLALEQYAHRYLTNVIKTTIRPNKKDPEFVFFDGDDDQGRLLYVYRIKPAIFDLVLAIFIAAYLGIVYMIAAHWSTILNILLRYKSVTNMFSSSSSSQYGAYKRKIN